MGANYVTHEAFRTLVMGTLILIVATTLLTILVGVLAYVLREHIKMTKNGDTK